MNRTLPIVAAGAVLLVVAALFVPLSPGQPSAEPVPTPEPESDFPAPPPLPEPPLAEEPAPPVTPEPPVPLPDRAPAAETPAVPPPVAPPADEVGEAEIPAEEPSEPAPVEPPPEPAPDGLPVSGIVLDEDRNEPAAGAVVQIVEVRSPDGPPRERHVGTARTDERGEFRLTAPWEGRYRIVVHGVRIGQKTAERVVDLKAEGATDVRVGLRVSRTVLTVRVEDRRGRPVTGPGMVFFRRPGTDDSIRQGVDLDGGGEGTILVRVPLGEWEVAWFAGGCPGPPVTLTLREGANGPVRLDAGE